jgi:hypothetical protein
MSDLDDLETIGPSELGVLLGRATKSIKLDSSRRPWTLPPRFEVPGSRALVWRVRDVRAWMEALAEIQAQERAESLKLVRETGGGHLPVKPFHLGQQRLGARTTEHMLDKDKDTK